jgi:hypothetical protein
MGESNKGPTPPLVKKSDNSPEIQALEMEAQVHRLFERSVRAKREGDLLEALSLAKQAVSTAMRAY